MRRSRYKVSSDLERERERERDGMHMRSRARGIQIEIYTCKLGAADLVPCRNQRTRNVLQIGQYQKTLEYVW